MKILNNILKNGTYIIILVLVIIVLLQYFTKSKARLQSNIIQLAPITTTINSKPKPVGILIPYQKIKYKIRYKIKYKDTYIPKFITSKDTLNIVKDYISKIAYIDTIKNDSTVMIIIKDTLQYNRIHSRQSVVKIFPQIQLIHTKLRTKIFVGLGMNGWSNKFGISGKVAVLDKRQRLYSLSYNPIYKSIELSIYWKIRLRKK